MIIWGALYKLLPVIIEEKLYSERLAKISFVIMSLGVIGLATGFWFGWLKYFVNFSGVIVLVAVSIFVFNVSMTGFRAKKKGVEQLFIRTSMLWLLLTVIIGVLAAINLTFPFIPVSHLQLLKLHAHAGIAGWFFLLVIGVASKLLPMFLVVEKLKLGDLRLSYFLINAALLSGLTAVYFSWDLVIRIALILGLAGLFSFMYFVFFAYRDRIKRSLDIGMRQTVVAFIFLLCGIVCMILIQSVQLTESAKTAMSIAYASSVFIGFFTALTQGQTYKTLPFIMWLEHYQDKVGKEKTLMPRDLYNNTMAGIQMILFALGFTLLMTGIFMKDPLWVRIAGILLSISALLYVYNIFKVIFHKTASKKMKSLADTKQDVFELLKEVIDPELRVNIVDLGLVYKAEVEEDTKMISVEMTLSSKGCPLGDAIFENLNQVLHSGYPGFDTDLKLVWEPEWNPNMITEAGKLELETNK